MKRRYFGTDGIRGEAGREPLTPEFVLRLGKAAGRYLRQRAERPVVLIGKDTRESGDLLEAALAAGLLSQGVAVEHLGILPTPGVAFLTAELGADASVVISASHNPYRDNGIKFFGPGGTKLSDEAEAAIEELLEAELGTTRIATVRNHQEAERIYMDRLVRIGPRLDGLRVAMDTANGATYRVAPRVFQRLGAEVFAVFTTPDGRNINKGCGSTHPETLARIVREGGFDLGVAFDGDGDRVVLIDRKGREASGDHLLFINAVVREEPLVVGTIMSNLGLERALGERGIAFERTPVGDRYVYEALLRRGGRLGGEQSGHVLFLEHLPTGDGIQTALLTLAAVRDSGRPLEAWVDALPMYPQTLVNVPVSDKRRVMEHPELGDWIARAEAMLGGGRINVRPSGTEPLVRIMAEGPEERAVHEAAAWLRERIKAAVE
ncbi:phosphoglucosamine mutase [Oceanithermus desulfurans]